MSKVGYFLSSWWLDFASAPSVISVLYSIIVGRNSQSVKSAITESKINWVLQEKQLGTGHAVQQAIPFINDDSICLILYGDVPLL